MATKGKTPTTVELDAETDAQNAADAEPFPTLNGDQIRDVIKRLGLQNVADMNVDAIQSYDDVSEALPFISKENLLGQPFVVLGVALIAGAAHQSEEADDLVFVYGQAVRLDGNGRIVEGGKHFTYNAGDNLSVHGEEMLAVAAAARPDSPVLIPHGLREVSAAKGSYYTVRPEASKSRISLF